MKATLEARARNELREHEVTDLCLKDLNGIPEAGMAEEATTTRSKGMQDTCTYARWDLRLERQSVVYNIPGGDFES